MSPGEVKARSTAIDGEVFLTAGAPPALPAGHWGNYLQATIDRLTANFGFLWPSSIAVDSILPLASGMSSSSALVCAVALALADQNNLWDRPDWKANIGDFVDLAAYLATIENGLDFRGLRGAKGVGTFGGSQDHTAMLNCGGAEVGVFHFAPTVEEGSLPLPAGYIFVVAVSGVLAEKTGSALEAHNNASLQIRRLPDLWNDSEGSHYTALAQNLAEDESSGRDRAPANWEQGDTRLGSARSRLCALADSDPLLRARLGAYLTEMEQAIPAAIRAPESGDVGAFGAAADLSHRNPDKNLGNQIPGWKVGGGAAPGLRCWHVDWPRWWFRCCSHEGL